MSPGTRRWISLILISASVERKLQAKHNLNKDQVLDACLLDRYLSAREEVDPERGVRLLVRGLDRDGQELLVLLKPVDPDDGIYRCITARMVR